MTMKEKKKTGFFQSTAGFTVVSIFLGLFIGGIILKIAGFNPFTAYWVIIKGVVSKPKYVAYTLVSATPLILTGLSVAFAFRTGLFNIGAEGQFIIGALVAGLTGYFWHLPPVIHVIVVIIVAGSAAAAWGGLSGYLKAKFGVNEVISTIMLNWIAFYLSNWIVGLPGIAKEVGVNVTNNIQDTARIDILGVWKRTDEGIEYLTEHPFFFDLLRAPVNLGFLFAILLVILIWFILNRTTLGYELRAVGFNKHAAEYGGINVKKSIIISMAISGALAGLAGTFHVLGNSMKVANLAGMEGAGFDGIAVALIGNTTAAGSVFGGLLFGILKYGGTKIQNELGAPTEIINIIIGTIVFFIAMPKFIKILYSIKLKKGGNQNAE
ncbi:MAG: ABC transporter permease [Spirochaetes bacterium]|nr:ABC transporter permease [Spirochaetota bacterium]